MLGTALSDRRDQAVIVTKVGFRTGDGLGDAGLACRHIVQAAEASLRRLGSDYLDVYLLHRPDELTAAEETAAACDDLVRRGLVRYTGYSNFPSWRAQQLIGAQQRIGARPLTVAQLYYSLLGREAEMVPFARANNLAVMTWAPLASGPLTGKYTRENPNPDSGRRAAAPFPPIDVDLGYTVVDRLIDIAQARDATPAQIALAWILRRDWVTSVLIGATTEERLASNIAAAALELSKEENDSLDQLTAVPARYPHWPQLTGPDTVAQQALDGR